MGQKRKGLSKKIRFEVFKRDKFTCQYCGRTVPDVVLHVDHIKPVAKGGTNDIMNLVTSCSDCNLGKSDRELTDDSVVKKQQARIQELAAKNEQLEMMLQWREELQKIDEKQIDSIADIVVEHTGYSVNDHGRSIIKKLIKKYTLEKVIAATDLAFEKYYTGDWESCEFAFNKIGGILYYDTKTDDPSAYWYNYLKKACRSNFAYFNATMLRELVDEIQSEAEFDIIKKLISKARNWTDFREKVEEELESGEV